MYGYCVTRTCGWGLRSCSPPLHPVTPSLHMHGCAVDALDKYAVDACTLDAMDEWEMGGQ